MRVRLILPPLTVLMGLFLGCKPESPPAKRESAKPATPEHAPAIFRVKFETSKGPFVLEVHREWAPLGADRFYELTRSGFYNGARFFRVVRNFVVQFGVNGDPSVSRLWSAMRIPDDPVREKNRKGTITFARSGPQTRTTQVFLNLRDNTALDRQGFAPFGKVISGMDVIERFYSAYGDMPPRGNGPDPSQIELQGNRYLEMRFPRLDYIESANIELP